MLDNRTHYIDIAPALQFIFMRNLIENIRYRLQASGNMERMNNISWQINLERIFLNAFQKN